jgi:hypothetical protein
MKKSFEYPLFLFIVTPVRKQAIRLSIPAVARDLFSSPNRADRLWGTQEAEWVLSLG